MAKAVGKNKVVGRIAVQVSPDTRGFPRELKAQMERVERQLGPVEIKADLNAATLGREARRAVRIAQEQAGDIRVGIDVKGLRKDWADAVRANREQMLKWVKDDVDFTPSIDKDLRGLDEALDRINKSHARQRRELLESWDATSLPLVVEPDRRSFERTRTLLDGFFERDYRGKIRFDVDEDSDRGWSALKAKVDREFADHANYKFKVDVDAAVRDGSIDGAIREIRNEFRRRAFRGEDFEIEVKPDMSNRELRELGHKLKRFKDKWDDTELEFELGLDHSSRYIATARLAYLARDRWVKLKPLVDTASAQAAAQTLAALAGFRLAKDLSTNLWDMVKNIDKAVPVFGGVGAAAAGLGAGITQLAKHTFTVAGSMGHILQMVGLLGPGFAVSGAMLAASFLVPLMRTADYVQDIKQDWSGLADAMSESFWQEGLSGFEQAHREVFPAFRSGLAQTSAAAGRHFGEISKSFAKIVAPNLPEMFLNVSMGLEALSRHADGFATVLDVLGRHGSEGMRRFADWLGRTTTSFAEWLDEAERTGRLEEMINRGVDALADFGRAAKNAGTTLGGVYEVARDLGGADLKSLADGLEKWSEVTHSAGFQEGLGRVFSGAGKAWDELKNESRAGLKSFVTSFSHMVDEAGGEMGRAGGKMLSAVAQSLSGNKFNAGMKDFFGGLSDGLGELGSTWGRVSNGLGSLLTFMGSLGRGFSPVIGSVLEGFADAAVRLEAPLSSIVESLGPGMGRALDASFGVAVPTLEALANILDVLAKIPGGVEAVTLAFMGWKTISQVTKVFSGIKTGFDGLKDAAETAALQGMVLRDSFTGAGGIAGAASTAKTKVGGLVSKLGSGLGLAGTLGLAGAAVGLLVAPLVSYAQKSAAEAESRTKTFTESLKEMADGAEGAAERVQNALNADKVRGNFWVSKVSEEFSSTRLEKGLKMSMNGWAGQVWADFASSFGTGEGSLLRDTAAEFERTFESLKELASYDPSGSAKSFQAFSQQLLASGASAGTLRERIGQWLDQSPEFEASMSAVAEKAGLVGDRAGVTSMLLGEFNLVQREAKVAADELASGTAAVTQWLDRQAASMGTSYEESAKVLSAVRELAPSFIDFGKAAEAAGGDTVASFRDVNAELDKQIETQEKWADNFKRLGLAGIGTEYLTEMSKLPDGAAYLQEMVKLMDDPSAEAQAEFEDLKAKAVEYAKALQGITPATEQAISAVSNLPVSFETLKSDIVGILGEIPAAAAVEAAKTPEEMVKALQDAGYEIEIAGNGLGVRITNGVRSGVAGLGEALNEELMASIGRKVDSLEGTFSTYSGSGAGSISGAGDWAQALVSSFDLAFSQLDLASEGVEQGENFWRGMVEGLSDTSGVSGGATNIGESVVDSSADALGERSPSVIARQQGMFYGLGMMQGLSASAPLVQVSAMGLGLQVAQGALRGLNLGTALIGPIGLVWGTQVASGLMSATPLVQAAGMLVSNAARMPLTTAAPLFLVTGLLSGSQYASGLLSGVPLVQAASRLVSESARLPLSIAVPFFLTAGLSSGLSYASGVRAGAGVARSAGSALSSSALSGASGVSLWSVGYNMGLGLASGLSASTGVIWSAAYSAAKAAESAAKSALDVHSPSRVAEKIGHFFDAGLANGLKGSAGLVTAAAADVALLATNVDTSMVASMSGNRVPVSSAKREGNSQPVLQLDGRGFKGMRLALALDDETTLETYVKDVSGEAVIDVLDAAGK